MANLPAETPIKQIDVNEAGRVLATLNDWRAIMFAELIIIAALLLIVVILIGVFVWQSGKRSASDEATLAALRESTKAGSENAASLRAVETILARMEGERTP